MIDLFHHSTASSWVTVTVDPDRSPALRQAALAHGVTRIFVHRGRGVLHRRKLGFLTLPAISPSFEILNFAVPRDRAQALLDALVAAGNLEHFGAGSIYATHLDHLWWTGSDLAHPADLLPPAPEAAAESALQGRLVAIQCISQVEHAEEIALAAMENGSPSPAISYGYGHGIRDRLGPFLQLTINPKKEILELVVGEDEAPHILDTMVEAGHLDQPAQGFISTRPVDLGLINTVSFHQASPYPASMEQIIRAIDQLQGNTNWRAGGVHRTGGRPPRKSLKNLVSLTCIVRRGLGDLCSLTAMEAGASGTSTWFADAVPFEADPAQKYVNSDEREVISLTVGQGQVDAVVAALTALPALKDTPVVIYACPAPVAVTYLK